MSAVDLGRAAYAEHRWQEAFEQFAAADQDGGLGAVELEQYSTAAFLLGQFTTGVDMLTKAHEGFLACGDSTGAARCAAWIGMQLMNAGENARSAGWFARAQRVVQESPDAGATEGFLIVPMALGALYGGDADGAALAFERAAGFAERFHDPDLMALSQLGQGQAQIMLGNTGPGLALLDEVMVAVTAGEISPIPAGIIYCAVVESCQLAFDLHRAQQWTSALDHWCDGQRDMVAFSGQCQMHRAQLYCLHGAWEESLAAARTAQERFLRGDRNAVYGAYYQQGEVQRLRGDLKAAEESYLQAGRSGFEPQPGLALLRLAQGRIPLAQSLIRRTHEEADAAARRLLLPALVEIELAAGDTAAAREPAAALTALCQANPMPLLEALAGYAEGELLLTEGDAPAAMKKLRTAWIHWQRLDAPLEAARCRVLMGRACRALGDEDSAVMEFEAARTVFAELGAGPALAAVELMHHKPAAAESPLTAREIEVLRLVSSGATNRLIAAELYLSEKTVARHLSNIFTKLGLTSRAAATAYAYRQGLV